MKQNYIYILVFILISGCKEKNNFEDFFKTEKTSISKILSNSIELDSIELDKIESSYTGSIDYLDNKIAFVDFRFCWVYLFDLNGNLLERKLGQGRSEDELNISFIDGYSFLPNGKRIFLGSTNDIHIYDRNWKKIKQTTINRNGSVPTGKGSNLKKVSPNDASLYSFDYMNFNLKSFGNSIFAPIYSEHKLFNGLSGMDYYKEGNILVEIDLNNISFKRLFGRRTPQLLKYEYLMHHSTFNFDIDKNYNFYISHEIDPMIYVYDREYKIQYAFGVPGLNMDTNYTEINKLNLKKFRQLYFDDRPKKGYYTGVKVFEDLGLVFRSYQKGGGSLTDGLQIYKDKVLVLDIDVPKKLQIKNFYAPYFYSNAIIDEENEKINIIRFKLPESIVKHKLN
ncbi:hypothetical protein KCTC32516_00577 [Polaribacter huanghezhanensis]|uniref:hypothetical protein n=1 Tax=Polaribacter huanghezhanensis TaxID=1354726 RepID=UPI002648E3EC|nr:hypothetical protein [Polaribacter huanghezhanensis]WKD85237.1 hypothetical protein KCTC32516_00577 [Polaribacter huanghezhanensis]